MRAYHRTYGLDATISNCSNNYGRYQFPEKLIPLMLINILHGKMLPIYGDGRHVRDWLHVEDHCEALDLVLKKGGRGEQYNIGGNCELPNVEVVARICAITDGIFAEDTSLHAKFPLALAALAKTSASLMQFVKDRPGHDRRYAIDSTRMRSRLGFAQNGHSSTDQARQSAGI